MIEGRAVWHLVDDVGELAATRCRIHGKQLQLTAPLTQVEGRKRLCLRCRKVARL